MDEADESQAREEFALDAALNGCLAAARAGGGSPFCADCGTAIPAARRQAVPNAIRCVDCQEEFES